MRKETKDSQGVKEPSIVFGLISDRSVVCVGRGRGVMRLSYCVWPWSAWIETFLMEAVDELV